MRSLFIILVSVALSGCGVFGEASRQAVPTLVSVAQAAGPYLLKMAKEKGVDIDKDATACFPVSDPVEEALEVELPALVLMCVAPNAAFVDQFLD